VNILFMQTHLLMAINLILVLTTFHGVHASDKLFFAFVFYIAIIFVYVCYVCYKLMGVVVQTFPCLQ
jgi:Mn2+/Fe2+ NRAMP family transporter